MGYESKTESKWDIILKANNNRNKRKRENSIKEESEQLGISIKELLKLKSKQIEEESISILSSIKEDTNCGGVYIIQNKITNAIYVGQTKNFYRRWGKHIRSLLNMTHHNSSLQFDVNKHGISNFDFKIVKVINDSKKDRHLLELEIMLSLSRLKSPLHNKIKDTERTRYKVIKQLDENNINYSYQYRVTCLGMFNFIIYKNKEYKHIDFCNEEELCKIKDNISGVLFIKDIESINNISRGIETCIKHGINCYMLYIKDGEIVKENCNNKLNETYLFFDLQVDDSASIAHKQVVEYLNNLGYKCEIEFKVQNRGDGRSGRIDIVAYKDSIKLAIEVDRMSPRNKSIFKLLNGVDDTYDRYILLRNFNNQEDKSYIIDNKLKVIRLGIKN